jgi:hypothetical protein
MVSLLRRVAAKARIIVEEFEAEQVYQDASRYQL